MNTRRGRRIVIIGAGIAGCSLADELTERGETSVTVIDQGPLFKTGGATSHAPGLVSRTGASRMLYGLADYTIEKMLSLDLDGAPCFLPVGVLEVATSDERMFELRRRHGFAASWGFHGRIVEPDECAHLHPLIDPTTIVGGFHTTGEGIGKALRAAEAQARRAEARGARFVGQTRVLAIDHDGGRVTGVRTEQGTIAADLVVLSAGSWGHGLAASAGVRLPMVPMEHQYAVTRPIPALAHLRDADASLPFVRQFDGGVYMRDEGDRIGIGSFEHRALPVSDADLRRDDPARETPSMFPFTPADFKAGLEGVLRVMPTLRDIGIERAFNGVFPYSSDGLPLIGEARDVAGLWVLECLWVTHAVGAARSLAEVLQDESPTVDITPADLWRFDDAELSQPDYEQRCANAYVDTYAIHHPAEPGSGPRDVRRSPFSSRQEALGAAFFDTAGWERPRWYEANAPLLQGLRLPARDAWSSRHWSPIAGAEHRATRERAGIYDLTSLRRITVTGRDSAAFLDRVCGRSVDGPVGSVRYTVLLDEAGRIVSDVTVARLGPHHFLVGGNSPRDAVWLRRQAGNDDVHIADVTAGTCCVAVWGPAARDLLAPIASVALGNDDFRYFTAREVTVGRVPVTAIRVSYVGELGWELTTTADLGLRLWDAIWEAGRAVGAVAAGRGALSSLRLEKGYRAWGQDMTREDTPGEAGLGFAVAGGDRQTIFGDALRLEKTPRRRLRTLRLDAEGIIPTGAEPVEIGDGRIRLRDERRLRLDGRARHRAGLAAGRCR